jgi:hypothetical protein
MRGVMHVQSKIDKVGVDDESGVSVDDDDDEDGEEAIEVGQQITP